MNLSWLERFFWEERDGVTRSFARRGDSKAGNSRESYHKLDLTQTRPHPGSSLGGARSEKENRPSLTPEIVS